MSAFLWNKIIRARNSAHPALIAQGYKALEVNGRVTGANSLSDRYELKWVAGQRGKPGVNGDINNATEATREIADPDFEVLGTAGTSTLSTRYAEGGITFTTDTTDGNAMILVPHLDANQSAWTGVTWGSDKETHWECEIVTAASVADMIIWAGLKLTNTSTTATDANQAFFRYEDSVNGGKWQAIASIGGTDYETDSGVAVEAATRYHLKVVIDAARKATFYINGRNVFESAALTNAIDFIPYIGVETDTSGAKAIHIIGQAISRNVG